MELVLKDLIKKAATSVLEIDTDERTELPTETGVEDDYFLDEDDYGQDVDSLESSFVYTDEPEAAPTSLKRKLLMAGGVLGAGVGLGIGLLYLQNEILKWQVNDMPHEKGHGSYVRKRENILEEVRKRDGYNNRDAVLTTPREFYDETYGSGYTARAEAVARRHRANNPDTPFIQNLDRLDTETPIYLNRDEMVPEGADAFALIAARRPFITLPTGVGLRGIHSDTDLSELLSHELVHTTQTGNNFYDTGMIGMTRDTARYRKSELGQGLPELRDALEGAMETTRPYWLPSSRWDHADYLTDPMEIEPWASALRRRDYAAHGVLPETPQEAERRITEIVNARPGTSESNLIDETWTSGLYEHIRAMPPHRREEAIRLISKIYPGLVQDTQRKEPEMPNLQELLAGTEQRFA